MAVLLVTEVLSLEVIKKKPDQVFLQVKHCQGRGAALQTLHFQDLIQVILSTALYYLYDATLFIAK